MIIEPKIVTNRGMEMMRWSKMRSISILDWLRSEKIEKRIMRMKMKILPINLRIKWKMEVIMFIIKF